MWEGHVTHLHFGAVKARVVKLCIQVGYFKC